MNPVYRRNTSGELDASLTMENSSVSRCAGPGLKNHRRPVMPAPTTLLRLPLLLLLLLLLPLTLPLLLLAGASLMLSLSRLLSLLLPLLVPLLSLLSA